MTDVFVLFLYGVYVGGFLGTLSRQTKTFLAADPGERRLLWQSFVIQPVLWPVFLLLTLVMAAVETHNR